MYRNLKGLSDAEVKMSREKHGDNSLQREKNKGFFRRFFENLNDPIIKVLIFALVIEVVFTFGNIDFFEVGGILTAILIATIVSTVSEHGSERAFEKMQSESNESFVRVIRSSCVLSIPERDIVVGDIVLLSSGEKIPADGIILTGSIKVDQSALNGESKEIAKYKTPHKDEWSLSDNGKVYRGSLITVGDAVMRVLKTGGNTYYGMVAKDVQTQTRESPLKLRLFHFASQISKIGYVMAILVAFAYLFNVFVVANGFVKDNIVQSFKDIPFVLSAMTHTLTLMITVIVVAAPEGLPMMITVVLSANMKKMLRDGVLVKKLVGIETAGSMNILFTDKTGTLTTGHLECDKIITSFGICKSIAMLKKYPKLYSALSLCAKYNTDSVISEGKVIGGNATDRALAEFFKGEKIANIKNIEKESFTSEKKYSSVTFENGEQLIKGAPERIIARCDRALSINGEIMTFDKEGIENAYIEAARCGERVIAVAKGIKGKDGLIFLSLIVLKDKIRRGVRESVRGVKSAGVQVVMLTGDGKYTAEAIARECGILSGTRGEIVITSDELARLSDEEVKNIIPNLAVLARALPQDKTRLVRLSQELELVVGMTGDGINDAPSLKLADVGFAMGTGADIAKGAGDIVIVDNSFFSINRTILYGRTIFKSIRKFITFQLMMNLTACGISLFGQFIGISSPITIIQMLWVNIIMDTLGGLAFAGEPALEYYMKEKPKKRNEAILSREMIHQIFFTGGYTLLLCALFLRVDYFKNVLFASGDGIKFLSAFYALFIFSGIFNCFGARCERMWMLSNIESNKPFIFIMMLISVIQIIMIYFGGSVFRTAPLLPSQLLIVLSLAFTVVIFEFIRRVFFKLSSSGREK